MAPIPISADEAPGLVPGGLVVAGVYPSYAAAFERSLVVLAQGWECWLVAADDGYRLLVEPGSAGVAQEQLRRFERESVGWPPKPMAVPGPARPFALVGPLLWSVGVLDVFWAQGRWPELAQMGALDAAAVFDRGEVWRAGTALFLHADGAHAVSNALGGIFVFSAVLSTFGRWRGWLLVALAAVVGNLVSAALSYPGPYRSLGASTAIFAGLGLLTGQAVQAVQRAVHPHRWRSLFVPFFAGFAVLALHGAGGPNVDVGAHVTGFVTGLAVGFAAAFAPGGKGSRFPANSCPDRGEL
jgi:membrane associated rhomboid family serine protease